MENERSLLSAVLLLVTMILRRDFLSGLLACGGLARLDEGVDAQAGPIDRAALVRRHNPIARKLDPLTPFSIGNGEFAFTADVTGLQTFPQAYDEAMPLCTMAQWGWHTTPLPAGLDAGSLRLTQYDTHGRAVGYQTGADGQTELFNWLRENPHRLHLGRIALRLLRTDGEEARLEDITDVEQELDLWSGSVSSRFKFEGRQVNVKTCVHPRLDLLAVTIASALIEEGRLAVRFVFPYGSPRMGAAEWTRDDRHQSQLNVNSNNQAKIERKLDNDSYSVAIAWKRRAVLSREKGHAFLLSPARSTQFDFVVAFSSQGNVGPLPPIDAAFDDAASHWRRFWSTGGAIELAGSRDARARELERRVVLSQYLTAIQCSGSQPPQETGLTVNSWYGKFHLEMHWWHAAHFPLWNRLPLLERSLDWYTKIAPSARALAKSQGYTGARWPKMVGPEGRDSPSPIGPLLIWQQPHPIFYAELCYQSRGGRLPLERYREIVFESAEFMASYAHLDRTRGRYVLGPPVIPAQENHPPRETWNPAFELEYWNYGLRTAQAWRERLGLKRNALWDEVISKLAPMPTKDDVYLAHENCPQTYTERNHDHPSMLGALGVLTGEKVDRETMLRTLRKVMKEWRWDETWGWDYPMTAMTAARVGAPAIAVDALMLETAKNRYLANGHNWQRANLPCYLPGNGGLLYAVALMAAGWKGAPATHAPGFPSDGSWTVRWEGLNSSLLQHF
jgi:hypothetical protein